MTERDFEAVFGRAPVASASAPGRVNLLGEHTDYNDGFVLPTAIAHFTRVQAAPSDDGRFHLYAAQFDQRIRHAPGDAIPVGFATYVLGCIALVEERGHAVPPCLIHIDSDVPIGAGLSSSAALEIAVLRTLRGWLDLPLSDVDLACIGQRAEINFAHVRCGIMDQMASSLADPAHMLFLDTRSLHTRLVAFPPGGELLVIDSGIPRTLTASAYNARRAECEQAALCLGVTALRDIDSTEALTCLPDLLERRARHVVTENQRVLEAASEIGSNRFGALMNASHASLRDDFEVSVAGLDELVGLLQAHPGVYGARLTGAGFGGACVAWVESQASIIGHNVLQKYRGKGRVLVSAAHVAGD